MHLFGLFLRFLTSEIHLIIRLLLVQLLVQSHIFFKNIFQLRLSLIKSSVVVVLYLLLPESCLLDSWNVVLFFRVN